MKRLSRYFYTSLASYGMKYWKNPLKNILHPQKASFRLIIHWITGPGGIRLHYFLQMCLLVTSDNFSEHAGWKMFEKLRKKVFSIQIKKKKSLQLKSLLVPLGMFRYNRGKKWRKFFTRKGISTWAYPPNSWISILSTNNNCSCQNRLSSHFFYNIYITVGDWNFHVIFECI